MIFSQHRDVQRDNTTTFGYYNSGQTISEERYIFVVTNFLGGTLGDRIYRLRKHLRSERKPLPFAEFAARMTAEASALGHDRRYNQGTLQRWETDPDAEPDILSLRLMAKLAGVPMYQFAVGEPEPTSGMVPVMPARTFTVQDEASVQIPTKAERDQLARHRRRKQDGETG